MLKIPYSEDERKAEEGDVISRERRLAEMSGSTYLRMRLYRCYRRRIAECNRRSSISGFTVIELMVVVVILAIAALTAIPMMSSASSMQIRSAANLIMADLEYAKSMAITRGQNYSVEFDVASNSYSIKKDGIVIEHPVKKGFSYVVSFPSESRLSMVVLTNVNFNGNQSVTFDPLGSPDNGGMVRIQAGNTTATITVEPVTGFISSQ